MTMSSMFRLNQQGLDAQRFTAPEVGVYEVTTGPELDRHQEGSTTMVSWWNPSLVHWPAQNGTDQPAIHEPVVFELTDTTFMFGCACGVSGPFRPTRPEAQQDSDQHRAAQP